jgi:hypothetical protein
VLHFNVNIIIISCRLFLICFVVVCVYEALMEHPGGEYTEPFKFPERRDIYSLNFNAEGKELL